MAATAGGDFWAITTYFNPARYKRRPANYRLFRDRLALPLLTVELAFDGEFELADGDADILVRLRGGDVMWQKERLLNLALPALPTACRNVAWVDCDVLFEADDWISRTYDLLDRHRLVQLFSRLYWMPRNWTPGQLVASEMDVPSSTVSLIAGGMPIDECLTTPIGQINSSPGFAWAARRDLLAEFGFYDACIVGGGDSALVRAAYGRLESAMRLHAMEEGHRAHFEAWATRFHNTVCGDVGYVEGALLHLWHGDWQNRRYRERYHALAAYGFDPYADISVDHTGVWRWSSDKEAMHAYVAGYLTGRREDG